MHRRVSLAILLFAILRFNHPAGFAESLNTIEISEGPVDDVYQVQARINLSQLYEREVVANESTYKILTLPEYGYTSEVGKPQLPAIRFFLAVPCLSDISIEVLETHVSILPKDYDIFPVQEPIPECGDYVQTFTID